MGRSTGFGSTICNLTPYSDLLSLRLHPSWGLALLHIVTRRLIIQKVRSHAFPGYPGHCASTACKLKVSGSISLPLQGFFSLFPHGTCALSVARKYLTLESGLPCFPRDFTGPAVLRNLTKREYIFLSTGLSPSMAGISIPFD